MTIHTMGFTMIAACVTLLGASAGLAQSASPAGATGAPRKEGEHEESARPRASYDLLVQGLCVSADEESAQIRDGNHMSLTLFGKTEWRAGFVIR